MEKPKIYTRDHQEGKALALRVSWEGFLRRVRFQLGLKGDWGSQEGGRASSEKMPLEGLRNLALVL